MARPLFTIAVFVLGLAVGAGVTYALFSEKSGHPMSTFEGSVERLKDRATPTPDGVPYTNERYGFSLRYPKGLVIKEFDEGGDSFTVVFQKPGEQIGFQVYITPHEGDTISGETILRDVPSGIVEDLKEEQITKNILAATFWSTAPLTGKNRELWFLHSGYLFEFTAYATDAGSDTWLAGIVKTVVFN
jgi:hypothetical protein